MLLATTVLRQQLRQNRQQVDNINAKLLAAFLASLEGEEAVLEQQMKDEPHVRFMVRELPPS